MSILAISLDDYVSRWWERLLLIIVSYTVITVIVLFFKHLRTKTEITLNICGIKVIIKEGDIFEVSGWKLIPFNEYFDTIVDDIIIAKNSLNGKFILDYLDEDGVGELRQAIEADDKSTLLKQYDENSSKWKYPLGRIKLFREYMLLALTRFNDQNEACTTRAEYEHALRIMWREISRTYANKPIYLPLIGTGITRFADMAQKSNQELLKCILCTLRTSNETINQPITILLTSDTVSTINLYELKGVNKYGLPH